MPIFKNKKKVINNFFFAIPKYFQKDTHLIFFAPVQFHFEHIKPIVKQFVNHPKVIIHIVGTIDTSSLEVKNNFRYWQSLAQLPKHIKYAFCLTTELETPWWLDVTTIFFGHGIGPKINYQASANLNNFDYCFAPCRAIYDAQQPYDVKVLKGGLPSLEHIEASAEPIREYFGFNNTLPIIVYAPSWNSQKHLISDIVGIVTALNQVIDYNVIICPHPLLLDSKRYEHHKIFDDLTIAVNDQKSGLNTLQICFLADIVISDISSILFESLALEKCVFLDGNDEVYRESGAINVLNELRKEVPVLKFDTSLQAQLKAGFETYVPNTQFIQHYLFNKDCATNTCERQLIEIMEAENNTT